MCRNSLERQGNVYMYIRIVSSLSQACVFRDVPTSAQIWSLPIGEGECFCPGNKDFAYFPFDV